MYRSERGRPIQGVHKDAHLIVVKHDPTLADGLSALEKITEDLGDRRERGEDIRGDVVINMSVEWPTRCMRPECKRKLEERINRLLAEFQAIVVVSGGKNSGNYFTPGSAIQTLPALMGVNYPIIIVGGVDSLKGHQIPRARRGPAVTVLAPYETSCLDEDVSPSEETIKRWTSYGAGIVTGVISALLSDDELGPILRRDKVGIPKRVKALIKKISYVREGGLDPAICNGVNGNKPQVWPPKV